MAVPGAQDWLLDRKIVPNQVGLGLVDEHPRLPETLARARARGVPHRRAGHQRPARRLPLRLRRPGPRVDRRARVPHAAAAQHALHPRHHVLAVRRPDHEPALLAGPPRRDAAIQGDLRVPPRLRRLDGVVGRPRAGLGPGDLRGRRHHAGRQRRGADGHERAHVAPGDHPGRRGALRAGAPPSAWSSPACPSCAPRCTSTRCSRSPTATSSRSTRRIMDAIHTFSLRPGDKAPGVEVVDEGWHGVRRRRRASPWVCPSCG